MPRLPRRLVLSVAAAVLALGTAVAVAGDLAALHRRAERLGPPTPVVVAARDLTVGTTLRPGDLNVRRLHEPPPGAIDALGVAIGRAVAVPVLAGSPVLQRHLASPGRSGLAAAVPRGMRAVRVHVEPEWRLPEGSVVDVLAGAGEDPAGLQPGGEPARMVAEGAIVLAGAAKEVTLLVSVEGARRLASAAAAGPLTLALAPPEDACCTTSSSVSSRG
jgi:Flp pilus assembly protein CpaB